MKTVTAPKGDDMVIRLGPVKLRMHFAGKGRKTRHEPRRSRSGERVKVARENF